MNIKKKEHRMNNLLSLFSNFQGINNVNTNLKNDQNINNFSTYTKKPLAVIFVI